MPEHESPESSGRSISHLIVWLAMAVYAAIMFSVCRLKFHCLLYTDFDLAVHSQSVWNILHGSLDSSILGIPFLGNHFVPILFLIAPLYLLVPSPLLLLFIQTATLAASAWGVFLIARRELPEKWALALSALYLLYPPLLYLNLYEFHPVAMATGLLIFTVYACRAGRFRLYLALLTLSLACQENIALIAIALGIYAWLARMKLRWILTPIIAGSVWFVLTVLVIMPRLNPGVIQFGHIYSGMGSSPVEIAAFMICHPLQTAIRIAEPGKLAFVGSLLGPLGFISLLSPLSLLPALPVLLQRLLSARPTESMMVFHYQAEFIPFVFLAAIAATRRILRWKSSLASPVLAGMFLVFPALAWLYSGLPPELIKPLQYRRTSPSSILDAHELIRMAPPRAPVAATFGFLAPMSSRNRLYSLHHVYIGSHTLSTVPYGLPEDTEYILMDTMDPLTFSTAGFYGPNQYLNFRSFATNRSWRIVSQRGSLLLLSKSADANHTPVTSLVQFLDALPVANTAVSQSSPGALQLLAFEVGPVEEDGCMDLALYWRKLADADCIAVVTIHSNGISYRNVLAPGNRIFPPQSWPSGKVIADRHRIRAGRVSPDGDEPRITVDIHPIP